MEAQNTMIKTNKLGSLQQQSCCEEVVKKGHVMKHQSGLVRGKKQIGYEKECSSVVRGLSQIIGSPTWVTQQAPGALHRNLRDLSQQQSARKEDDQRGGGACDEGW